MEAEHHISNQTDKTIVARLFKAKMVAYQDIFDYKSAITSYSKSYGRQEITMRTLGTPFT